MFCKYCGTNIDDDSVFCVHCGKNIKEDVRTTPKVTEEDKIPIRTQLVNVDNSQWKSTDNLQWVKPIGARITQTILLLVGLFFLCYGITWSCIIEEKVSKDSRPCSYPFFDRFEAYAEEPLGIISVFVDLERDDPDFSTYKSEWESLYIEKYDDKWKKKVFERLCKEWGINTSIPYNPYGYPYSTDVYWKLSDNQKSQVSRALANEEPANVSIPYDYAKYYLVADKMAVSKFRIHAMFIFMLPSLIIILLSIIWMVKITPKSDNKLTLPRDYADKIESYTWNGFSLHKYVRFIKDDKYGILDAANRSITVPATFELIEWREKNKSYDGVLDGVRKTYFLTNN